MKVNDFEKVAEDDDIALQIEQFKMGLVAIATGGDGKEYALQCKMILGIPGVEKIVPKFLKLCRSVDDFWGWIKGQAPTYAERRLIIAEALNPILEMMEYEAGEASLEFQKNYQEIGIITTRLILLS